MAKEVKDKYLGARVTGTKYAAIETYTDAAEINMGDLLRAAVDEYMVNHPVKVPRSKADYPLLNDFNKPGKEGK